MSKFFIYRNRTAYLAVFAVALVLSASPLAPRPASAFGVTPVLSATPGDGEVGLSWTDWVPEDTMPPDWMVGAILDYRYCMRVEGVGCSADQDDWTYVDGTSTTVSGLENGKEYSFQVVGRQRGEIPGGQSPLTRWLRLSWPSNEVTVTPSAPGE